MSEKKKTNTNMAQSILTNMLVSVEKQFIEQLFTEEGLKEYQVYVEADEWMPISEVIHDDWFDECKQIMDLMDTNIRGVFSFDRHNDWY